MLQQWELLWLFPAAAPYSQQVPIRKQKKSALANVVSKLPEAWDGYLENYQKACKGTKGTFTLTVEDTGRALAGALMGGTDVSWLQSFTFDSDITIKDGVEAIASGLLLERHQTV